MKRKCGIVVLLAALFLALFAMSAQAECAHTTKILKKVRAATCCVAGRYDRVCKACGKVITVNAYRPAATGKHPGTKSVMIKKATCTTNGTISVRCKLSGKQLYTRVALRTGHRFQVIRTKPATCTAMGYKIEKCIRCDYRRTTPIRKTGHTPVLKTVVEPTCCYRGLKDKVCSVCNKLIKAGAEEIPATQQHAGYTTKITVQPTCYSDGVEEYYCTTTGFNYGRKTWRVGHQYTAVDQVFPTCTTDGYILYECSVCHHQDQVAWGTASHSYEIVECTEEIETLKCKECGATKTQPHKCSRFTCYWYWRSNGTSDGLGTVYTTKACSDCNKKVKTAITENVTEADAEVWHENGLCPLH